MLKKCLIADKSSLLYVLIESLLFTRGQNIHTIMHSIQSSKQKWRQWHYSVFIETDHG